MDRVCFVLLGNRCNQACSYCYQDKEAQEFSFDEKIIPMINAAGSRVLFYGGEPLLYFDKIEYIVRRLAEKSFINITTNGTLLTANMVEFFNKYNVHISLSHDGLRHKELRGYEDPLVTHGDVFVALKHKSLLCVVNNMNYDYYNMWNYLRDSKLTVPHSFQHVKWCGSTPEQFLFKNNQGWENLLADISDRAVDDIRHRRISNEVLFFRYYLYGNREFCSCRDGYTSIDLQGTVYACHNYKLKRGENVFCRSECEAMSICGGGCLCEPNEYDCYLYKTLYRYCEKIRAGV